MALSVDEIATSKKAFSEIRDFEYTRFSLILWGCFMLFFTIFTVLPLVSGAEIKTINGQYVTGWKAAHESLSFFRSSPFWFWITMFLVSAFRYYRSKSNYAQSLKLVTEIEQKHPGEFPYGLEQELQRPPYKLEKKPLLWRLDAFLGRKSVEK